MRLFVSLLCVLSAAAHAEPWELVGANIRDMSMAGAGVAGALPGAAIPIDPGAVAGVNGEVVALAYRRTMPSMRVGEQSLIEDPINALDMSMAFGAPLGKIHAGAGFAMYLPLPEAVGAFFEKCCRIDRSSRSSAGLSSAFHSICTRALRSGDTSMSSLTTGLVRAATLTPITRP